MKYNNPSDTSRIHTSSDTAPTQTPYPALLRQTCGHSRYCLPGLLFLIFIVITHSLMHSLTDVPGRAHPTPTHGPSGRMTSNRPTGQPNISQSFPKPSSLLYQLHLLTALGSAGSDLNSIVSFSHHLPCRNTSTVRMSSVSTVSFL